MSTLRDALSELPDAVFADLLESESSYLLVLDLPGVTAESADLKVEKGRLVVEARRDKRTPTDFDYVREERPLFLDAELPLPPDAVADEAEASMERGVLEVRLPKREAASGRTIPITTGDDVDDGVDEDA
ncbi:Hsp20/alpha crystallin family protein [Haloferax sp. DFSO52]|uniref:Hsp20/alpha crystallin family protein n=1 Tax=Haloferax sp. DFSO52 TaxID=3388505 RepID=UPI003A8A8242